VLFAAVLVVSGGVLYGVLVLLGETMR